MEQLNKTQLILLALLISFVSSIATGIITVTLMQQAPQAVSQTINRVVERTIEKVIPIKGPTLTETKLVKEEDLIVAAIDANTKNVVKIEIGADPGTKASGQTLGYGAVLTTDGYIATDSSVTSVAEETYFAEAYDGSIYQLARVADKRGFTLLKVLAKDKNSAPTFASAVLADSSQAKVGQSIISLGDVAATGIISGLSYDVPAGEAATTTQSGVKTISQIHTSTNAKDSPGSIVINKEGKVLGVVGTRAGVQITIPADYISDAVSEAQKKQ